MTRLVFRNTVTGKTYDVVRLDKERGVVILKGPNAQFEEPYDKENFKRLGYVLEKQES